MSITLTTDPRKHITGSTYCRWSRAYNPYLFAFTFSAIPAGATSLKVEAQVMDKASTVISTHEAYAMSLVAKLDVQKAVQSMITDKSTFNENATLNDSSLYVAFYLNYRESYYTSLGVLVQGAWTKTAKYFAVRGVVQIPDDPNLYDTVHNLLLFETAPAYSSTGELLTSFTDRILPVWAGYPRDIALAMAEFSLSLKLCRAVGGVVTSTTITQDGVYPGFVCRAELSTTPGHTYPWTSAYITGAGVSPHTCSRAYTIENMTVGTNPFYIRWRNQYGGFDYWLFEKRQVINYAASDTKTVRRDITDFSTARGTHKVYNRKGSKAYLVGATNLNEIRWNALNYIQYSAMIEYWDGVNWIEIIPEDGASELINDKPAGEIEYLFYFPEMQMSY